MFCFTVQSGDPKTCGQSFQIPQRSVGTSTKQTPIVFLLLLTSKKALFKSRSEMPTRFRCPAHSDEKSIAFLSKFTAPIIRHNSSNLRVKGVFHQNGWKDISSVLVIWPVGMNFLSYPMIYRRFFSRLAINYAKNCTFVPPPKCWWIITWSRYTGSRSRCPNRNPTCAQASNVPSANLSWGKSINFWQRIELRCVKYLALCCIFASNIRVVRMSEKRSNMR